VTRSDRYAARIAVDLLGGDAAPDVVVDGALHVLLVGPDVVTAEAIGALPAEIRARASAVTAGELVGMGERPVPAVRAKANASVRIAMETVRDGAADAVVTAGSTGAAVAAAHVVLGASPGVHRPALGAVIPAATGPVFLLDVGATPWPKPDLLVAHALLGVAYARVALGLPAPRVGLLSNGSEPGKGDSLRRKVDRRLAGLGDAVTYVGFVEGHQVPLGGPADVVVTDGFTGNVLLKGMEGVVELLMRAAADAPDTARAAAPDARAAVDAPDAARAARAAVLLGVPGTVVVGHGAATGGDIARCIAHAAEAVRGDHLALVTAEFDALRGHGAHPIADEDATRRADAFREVL
jgi:glycerol-3-phosphate acyltransferase PlsX